MSWSLIFLVKLIINNMKSSNMQRYFLIFIFIIIGQFAHAQSIDTTIYLTLVKSDIDNFESISKTAGFVTSFDTTSQTMLASKKGLVYAKPIGDKNDNAYYKLALIVSTQNKENNKLILRNAKEKPNKKGTWVDDEYMYIEWDMKNPISDEIWYKLIIYKKK